MSIGRRIQEKIARVIAFMNNAGTEGEATAAAAALQRLCAEHNLSVADVASVNCPASEQIVEEVTAYGAMKI